MLIRGGAYLGYVGHANLGDEAMWEVCRKRFGRIHWSPYGQLAYRMSAQKFLGKTRRNGSYLIRWLGDELRSQSHLRTLAHQIAHRVAARLGGEVAVLGGGTLINSNEGELQSYRSTWERTSGPVPVFGTGVKSPEFWSTKPGWTDRRKEWVAVMNQLPIIGVRGPISKALLEEAGARNVIISGDPAVWFHQPLQAKQAGCTSGRDRRIGINCGKAAGGIWGDETQVEAVLARVARNLHQDGTKVELVAVCPQDVESCHRIAALGGLTRESVLPQVRSVSEFFKTAKRFDLLIALKLHAAILAAAANLPFVMLAYQPKCLDFTASIGWEHLTLRTDSTGEESLMRMVSEVLKHLADHKYMVCETMCRISKGFEEYCCSVENLLMCGQKD